MQFDGDQNGFTTMATQTFLVATTPPTNFFIFLIAFAGDQNLCVIPYFIISLACQGKDIVFRFIIEYNSLKDFGP